ncbi:MAG: hypothetical protein M3394_09230, partial [Actinomycetota bacterium]|nr:hypothetical protein [Actinomycetota bacterium]
MSSAPAAAALPEWLSGARPRPTLPALLGATGGLLAQLGAFLLLDDVDVRDLRAFAVAVASFTLSVGLFLTYLERRGALHAAGVALSATAVLPLALGVVAAPEGFDSRADVLLSALLAVLVWLVLFAFGPARGHGVFLGLALIGAWLGAVSQTVSPSTLLWITPLTAVEPAESRVEVRTTPLEVPAQSIPTFTVPTFSVPRPVFPERVVPVPGPGPTTDSTFPFPTFPTFEFRQEQPQPSEPPP